jgi:hypothetical protein
MHYKFLATALFAIYRWLTEIAQGGLDCTLNYVHALGSIQYLARRAPHEMLIMHLLLARNL